MFKHSCRKEIKLRALPRLEADQNFEGIFGWKLENGHDCLCFVWKEILLGNFEYFKIQYDREKDKKQRDKTQYKDNIKRIAAE